VWERSFLGAASVISVVAAAIELAAAATAEITAHSRSRSSAPLALPLYCSTALLAERRLMLFSAAEDLQ